MTICVQKRDGRTADWSRARIERALSLAWYAWRHGNAANTSRDNPLARWGLGEEDGKIVQELASRVEEGVEGSLSVEQIQDKVERVLVEAGYWEVAKLYTLYRSRHDELRMAKYGENGLSEYIALAKYSRYDEKLGRRETYVEAVGRVEDMHMAHFAAAKDKKGSLDGLDLDLSDPLVLQHAQSDMTLQDEIRAAFNSVRAKDCLPSMRSLQFGGDAVFQNNARIFNCSFGYINRIRAFSEAMYLLLSGTGVGFSIQRHHVAQIPAFPARARIENLVVRHHTIEDTIEGWADALEALLRSYLDGVYLEFDYSSIRAKGSRLKTSGGRAPGHLPLKKALVKIADILDHISGRAMRPIEAYDILMHAAEAVLSGGIRRSATIALFSPDDEEMASAKTGNWLETNPQRQGSNNSAVLVRTEATSEQFASLFEKQKEYGEPGFYFSDNSEYGTNPCSEIGLAPYATVTERDIDKLRTMGYADKLTPGDTVTGWQMCNLTTINGGHAGTPEMFYRAVAAAAAIGTLQASYTDIPYLGPVTRFLNEREALLGVSITGIMDNPDVLLNPDVLERGARIAVAVNARVARTIGIRQAARVTAIKPEGTSSLLLGTGSGIHAHHAKHYFRRVKANKQEPVYQFFRMWNEHMTESSVYKPATDDVICFPVEAPANALTKDKVSAMRQLECVKLVQRHWVMTGRAHIKYNPGLHHNVSNTISVTPEEWVSVRDFIWENREYFTGISLLAASGDKIYPQAPLEAVIDARDVQKWNSLVYQAVPWDQFWEETDETSLRDIAACAGGACEIV